MVAFSELGRQLEGGAPLADVLAAWRASRPDAFARAEARRRARLRAALVDDLREEALRNGSLAAVQSQQLTQAAERLEAATAGLQGVTAALHALISVRTAREERGEPAPAPARPRTEATPSRARGERGALVRFDG